MGKKTLYHPVSLHVLRGALEYCDIKIGRLVQTSASLEFNSATYRATITEMPGSVDYRTSRNIANALQECFAQDVTVLSVTSEYNVKTRKVTNTAILFVQTPPEPDHEIPSPREPGVVYADEIGLDEF